MSGVLVAGTCFNQLLSVSKNNPNFSCFIIYIKKFSTEGNILFCRYQDLVENSVKFYFSNQPFCVVRQETQIAKMLILYSPSKIKENIVWIRNVWDILAQILDKDYFKELT